jgi:hypothetical protein
VSGRQSASLAAPVVEAAQRRHEIKEAALVDLETNRLPPG